MAILRARGSYSVYGDPLIKKIRFYKIDVKFRNISMI